MSNSPDLDAADASGFSWTSLRPKLNRLLESPSLSVRVNLAALAAAMASNREALDLLVSMAAEAAGAIVNQRGDSGRVLAAVLRERAGLGEAERSHFDHALQQRLGEDSADWPRERLLLLLRDGMPVRLLPPSYLVDEIFEIAWDLPSDPRKAHEITQLNEQRGKVAKIRDAVTAADGELLARLAEAAAERLATLDESQRAPTLFGLMELWPDLAQRVAEAHSGGRGVSLVAAAKLRRTGALRSVWRLLGIAFLACAVLFLVPRLGSLVVETSKLGDGAEMAVELTFWTLLLAVFAGVLPAVPLLVQYLPNASLRLPPYQRLRINLGPVAVTAALSAFVLFFELGLAESDVGLGGPMLVVFVLTLLMGAIIVVEVPLLAGIRWGADWKRQTAAAMAIAAPPAIIAVVLATAFKVGDSGRVAMMSAHVLAGALGMAAATWLAEIRRYSRADAGGPPRATRALAAVAIISLVALALVCLAPLVVTVWTSVRPVRLSADTPTKMLRPGVVYRMPAGQYSLIEASYANNPGEMGHNFSIRPPGAEWVNTRATQTADDNADPTVPAGTATREVAKSVVVEGGSLLCYNCWRSTSTLLEFVQGNRPFWTEPAVQVTLRWIRRGRPVSAGAEVAFGEVRSFASPTPFCLLGEHQYKLWPEGSLEEHGTVPENAAESAMDSMEMPADEAAAAAGAGSDAAAAAAIAAADAEAASAVVTAGPCADVTPIPSGKYRICFHSWGDSGACDVFGWPRRVEVRGTARFRYAPVSG